MDNRRRGRPRLSWVSEVLKHVTQMEIDNAIICNPVEWRKAVNNYCFNESRPPLRPTRREQRNCRVGTMAASVTQFLAVVHLHTFAPLGRGRLKFLESGQQVPITKLVSDAGLAV